MQPFETVDNFVHYQNDLLTFDMPGTHTQKMIALVKKAKIVMFYVYKDMEWLSDDLTDYDFAEFLLEFLLKEKLEENDIDELMSRARVFGEKEIAQKLYRYKTEKQKIDYEDIELIFMHVNVPYYATILRIVFVESGLFGFIDTGVLVMSGRPVRDVW